MAEDWRVQTAIDKMRVLRYLLALADERGITHGEKHHLIQVIGMISVEILSDLGAEHTYLERNIDKSSITMIRPF